VLTPPYIPAPAFAAICALAKCVFQVIKYREGEIREIYHEHVPDSELDAAQSLAKNGFVRATGAVAGVVLEKHLAHVCEQHGLKSRKKRPSIADFYQLLKEASVIETTTWRYIQHLGDVRNLCDHGKDREPTREEVLELIEGVKKVSKSVF
jgi:hypothetical protein